MRSSSPSPAVLRTRARARARARVRAQPLHRVLRALAAAALLGGASARAADEPVAAGEEALAVAVPAAAGAAVPTVPVPEGLVPEGRLTRWSPGIPGGVPRWTRIHGTIKAEVHSVRGSDPDGAARAINAALEAAAAAASESSPQVVFVEPGTYRITEPIRFKNYRYVVLRGAGPTATRLRGDFPGKGNAVVWFNGWPSGNWAGRQAVDVLGDVPRGATRITVRSAVDFEVGDVVQLDQLDDPSYVYFYDGVFFKRGWKRDWIAAGPLSPKGYRSVNELLEVVGKKGNVLTVSAGRRADGTPEPFGPHIGFEARFHPQVFVKHTTRARDRRASAWCGVEDLYVTGGTSGTIRLWNTAYSWVKNVEIDGDPRTAGIPEPPGGYAARFPGAPSIGSAGSPVSVEHCFRCEVRDSYVHHTQSINQGGGSYGIVLRYGTSNTLVENNIVVYFNKCITAATSGGGNVVAYNYVDNAFTRQRGWQEGAIDLCHQAFCHMDLAEGNWTAEMGADSTHGNSGWLTFFRNYARGGNTGPTPEGTPARMTGNTHAVQITAWLRATTFVGNVLEQPNVLGGRPPVYEYVKGPTPAAPVWRIGDNLWSGNTWESTHGTIPPRNVRSSGAPSVPADDVPYVVAPTFRTKAIDELYRHGNWDSVTRKVVWDPKNRVRALPSSLYLEKKPAFFGDLPWPWVDPTGATPGDRVKILPAKARYDAGKPVG